MTRKLFAFLLGELNTVRVICTRTECGAVTEVSVEQLATRFDRSPHCPLCKKEFFEPRDRASNALERLGGAIRDLQAVSKRVQVEFILPDTTA